jgi:hypothetical protein
MTEAMMRGKRKPVAEGLRQFWVFARRDLAQSEPVRLAALRRRLAPRPQARRPLAAYARTSRS